MYLYGASGHAKVIIEILKECGDEVDELFDDDSTKKELLNRPVLRYDSTLAKNSKLIVSIGNNSIRKSIVDKLINADYGNAIHPFSSISISSKIGNGTVVMPGVCINSDAEIGKHCIVNTNSSIDHDCRIEDFVHISPGVVLCGNVTVGEGTLIGAGTVIIPGIRIGRWCTIGAGSVVIRDIPDESIAVGNPCQVIKSVVPTT